MLVSHIILLRTGVAIRLSASIKSTFPHEAYVDLAHSLQRINLVVRLIFQRRGPPSSPSKVRGRLPRILHNDVCRCILVGGIYYTKRGIVSCT
jgi:hypothetical protein